MTTGEKIRELRLKKGYTQEELGRLIGVQKAAINKYETNIVVNLKRSIIQKLSEVLEVSPLELLDPDSVEPVREQISEEEHILFRLAKGAKPEALRAAVAVLKSYEETNDDF